MKWQVDEIVSWQNGKMMKWHVWKWQVDEMKLSSKNCNLTNKDCQVDGNCKLTKRQADKITGF